MNNNTINDTVNNKFNLTYDVIIEANKTNIQEMDVGENFGLMQSGDLSNRETDSDIIGSSNF